jgi:quercetin dioxygenase-like cupin family protein
MRARCEPACRRAKGAAQWQAPAACSAWPGKSYGWAMIRKANPRGYHLALPGIERKTLAYGEHTLMTEFHMHKGSSLPAHAHPHEQTGYLVSGRIRLTIAGRSVDVRPGGSWSIPGNTKHGAAILEDSVAIEVFSPVREDYLPARLTSRPRARA